MSRRAALAATVAVLLVAAGCGSDGDPEPAASDGATQPVAPAGNECEPTRADAVGPFYEPGAPVRDDVGDGYVLSGQVLSAADCEPLPGAEVEIWLVGPDGEYDDAHRATVRVDGNGRYRFESNPPVGYEGRPPHIHLLVTAPGHPVFVTQHYPEEGDDGARFDIRMPSG